VNYRKKDVKRFGTVAIIKMVIFIIGLLSLTYCRKDKSVNTNIDLYLMDAPAYFEAVNVDIQKIYIKYEGSGNEQEVKMIRPGVYNLLDFTNGKDTLLGSIAMPAGKIIQVRIVFGQNNSFISESTNINLGLAPEIENGVTINTDEVIGAVKNFKLWIDFDASRSIISTGNDNYLNPVVRVISESIAGGIRGLVIPEDRRPFIYAISGSDSVGTITDKQGHFLIKGLKGGIYKLRFIPQKPKVKQAVIDSVEVKEDTVKYIGTIVIN
jgi:hypothetical protein